MGRFGSQGSPPPWATSSATSIAAVHPGPGGPLCAPPQAPLARAPFEVGLRECPDYSAPWQAYGMLEVSVDAHNRARRCFEAGLTRCPGGAHTVQLLQVRPHGRAQPPASCPS